jgi:MFS transporter, ACS family, tartrate transporter
MASLQTDAGATARGRIAWRLLPFLFLLYIANYLDRTNIAYATLGMKGELGLNDSVFGTASGIFFIGYFALQVPGALLVERWSARRLLALTLITWGALTGLTAFVRTPLQLYGARFLLGAAEAGFFPGVIVYLSHWYPSAERARAKTYFMLTQPLAIMIGFALSRWILETVHWRGLAGWHWVFILEGLPSIGFGIATFFYLTDRPRDAHWLPADEKQWLIEQLEKEARERTASGRVRVLDALRQPATLLLIAIYFLIVSGNQGLIFFLPSVVDEMKSLPVVARTLVTMLPYLLGIGAILLAGLSAHRTGERRWHTAGPMFLSGIALAFAILSGHRLASVILFYCLAAGASQAYLPAFWTLPTAYFGKAAAATAIGLINSIGSLGGFAGPYLFGYLRTSTGSFEAGLWCLVACSLLAGLLATRIKIYASKN